MLPLLTLSPGIHGSTVPRTPTPLCVCLHLFVNAQRIGTPTTVCDSEVLGSHGIATSMYAFGRSRQGLLVVLQVFGLLGGRGSHRVAEAHPTVNMTVASNIEVFSPQWAEEFSGHKLGCELGRVSYTWRYSGFGSNINSEYRRGRCWPQRSISQRALLSIRLDSSVQRLRKLMRLVHRNVGFNFLDVHEPGSTMHVCVVRYFSFTALLQ